MSRDIDRAGFLLPPQKSCLMMTTIVRPDDGFSIQERKDSLSLYLARNRRARRAFAAASLRARRSSVREASRRIDDGGSVDDHVSGLRAS